MRLLPWDYGVRNLARSPVRLALSLAGAALVVLLVLAAGAYQVVFNEIVDLPTDLMALGRPRSSLCRCGVQLHTAVWDAGYSGRSEALLVVYNPAGFRVRRGARVLQLVFVGLDQPTRPYDGRYQGENA